MDVRLTVPVFEWMKCPALARVMGALGAGNALLVGGCVRSAVLGENVPVGALDIDIACVLRPEVVMARMQEWGIKVVPTGIDFGTVTAVVEGQGFEITTLRQDVLTDGRHAQVVYSQNWLEDAQRRDFTMNTLLMDMEGRVFDPTGQGVDDLLAGKVVFVGDADRRIAEDYLRILRFFRFHARYGSGAPDTVGLQACLRAKFHIAKLSRERITQEYVKLLPAKGAGAVLELLREYSILPDVVAQRFNQSEYVALQELAVIMGANFDLKLLFAHSVWRNKVDTVYSFLAKYFVLSKDYMRFLNGLFAVLDRPYDSYRKNAYIYGRDVALGFLVFSFVINDKDGDVSGFLRQYNLCLQEPVMSLPIGGGDVAQITGLEQGVELGRILKKVESWWFDNGMVATRDALLEKIKEFS